jgi:DNA-binding transcriptional ArsR family regulator
MADPLHWTRSADSCHRDELAKKSAGERNPAPLCRGRKRGYEVEKTQRFDDKTMMKSATASERLAALGNETRLAIFRLLMQAGSEGISAGVICEKLKILAPTLSFHLGHLSRVGLIRGRKESRFIFYTADYAAMDDLLAYLTDNCCQGAQCLPKTAACATAKKSPRARA